MRVHIVAAEVEGDQILARMVRDLCAATGWTADDHPDPQADLNYMLPYLLMERFPDFTATPTAAWFTHYDKGRKGKEQVWDAAAARVDLRLTSAKLYIDDLAKHGPTALVTPYIDLAKFTPVRPPRDRGEFPLVGISGFVYPGGRKGEGLVKQLAASELGKSIRCIASGRGWPVPIHDYTWETLQDFYRSLDIYLCTASIEGIPAPPLEAMACGVPVVVPRKVGIMDELPDLPNIHRYTAGDYKSMEQAIRQALDTPVDREALRQAAEVYCLDAWVETHRQAFEAYLYDVPAIEVLPDWHGKAAVYHTAYGKPARECAQRLMMSLRDIMPDLPIILVSDKPIGLETVFIEHPDSDVGARGAKTKIDELAPAEFEYLLYLDADTQVVDDISFLFDLLQDGWELVFCTNPAQYVVGKTMIRPDNTEEVEETFAQLGTDEFLQYNGGVFAYRRNERTRQFIREWHTEWLRYGKRDQAALDRALYRYPVRVFTLGGEWNCVTRYHPNGLPGAAIMHYPMTARRWAGRIEGRLDSGEAWAVVHPSSFEEAEAIKPKKPRRRKGMTDE